MARGWESKSVEAQQADRAERPSVPEPAVSLEEAAHRARRKTLELARARMRGDLATATRPEHRAMLEAAIRALDGRLKMS